MTIDRIITALRSTPIAKAPYHLPDGNHSMLDLTLQDILLDHMFLRDGPMPRKSLGLFDDAVGELIATVAKIALGQAQAVLQEAISVWRTRIGTSDSDVNPLAPLSADEILWRQEMAALVRDVLSGELVPEGQTLKNRDTDAMAKMDAGVENLGS